MRPLRPVILVAVALVAALLAPSFDRPVAAEQNEGGSPALVDAQRRITAGSLHTCAVLDTGGVQCWGANDHGQLGNDSIATSNAPQYAQGISTALAVTAGASHSCALLHGGTVACWGLNGSGQLGDGTTDSRDTPVLVSGVTTATAVAAGSFHTCALLADSSVRCWGHDGAGQLGDGASPGPAGGTALVPVAVNGISDAVSIAGGEFHTCATRSGGGVSCWGHNGFGQLGDGTKADRDAPVAVSGIPDADDHKATAVAAGNGHTCALLDDAKARCWGANDRGQLGDGTTTGRTSPGVVKYNASAPPSPPDPQPLTGLTTVTAGEYHSCARTVGGKARCWGDNGRGQLGDGTTEAEADNFIRKLAVEVLVSAGGSAVTGVSAVTAGGFHTCALVGTAMSCWGYNFHAQLGGYAGESLVPVTVTALRGAARVGTGTHHACALLDQEAAPPVAPFEKTACWGTNAQGQLGANLDPALVPKTIIPVPVPGSPVASGISAGNGHVCVVASATSGASCWGRNETGQLGDGSTTGRRVPVAVAGLTDATQLSAHGALSGSELGLTCARGGDGTARCWGANGSGQLGNGTTGTHSTTPATVVYDHDNSASTAPVPLTGIVEVAAGGVHACAVLTDTKVRCWGANGSGQLGDDTTDDRTTAVLVLTKDEDGDPTNERVPLTGVSRLAAGANHTCAVMSDGKVNCWGANGSGQLGDGTNDQRKTPVEVKELPNPPKPKTNAIRITAGDDHNCVMVQSTALRCWGGNGAGQLGDNSKTSRNKPVEPVGLGSPKDEILDKVHAFIHDVSAGRDNTCAVMLDTTVSCWGNNTDGQLGDGLGAARLSPIAVQSLGAVNGNHIPNPGNDAFTTSVGVSVVFPPPKGLLANDTDADGTALSAAIGTPPGNGTAIVNANGTGSYTPNSGFCGKDTFTYTVTDGTATVPATVTITIPCPNSPPVAGADSATLLEDGTVAVDVLANDSDPDGDPLSISSAGVPAHGTAQVVAGKISYTPDGDWCTSDSFTYALSDGPGGHTSTGTVSITITCVNDPPVANADHLGTPEDTSATLNLIANDSDPDGPSLAVSAFSQPARGTVVSAGPGSVTYTPSPDYCGTDSFGYTASDGTDSSSATVTVTVACSADPPVANDDVATTTEDTPVTRAVLGNDTDPDGDTLFVAGVGAPANGHATFTSTSVTYTPNADYCGTDSFTYTVSDGGLTDTANVTVTVSCVNDAPVANDDNPGTPEDTPATINPLANDTDPDGDTLVLGAVTDPPNGTVARSGSSVVYTPDGDFCGSDPFTYTISDGRGGTDTGTVTVSVACVNDAPVLAPIADRTVPWGSPVSLTAGASDPDAGDAMTFSLATAPAGASIGASSGAFTWTPASDQIGDHLVTVRVTDGSSTDDEVFMIRVAPQPPAIAYTGATSGQYSDPVTVAATLNDGGGGGVSGRVVEFTIGSQRVTAVTDTSGSASTTLTLADAAGPWNVRASFAGDGLYGATSALSPFTILKESVSVSFSAAHLVTTTGTSAPAPLAATVTEIDDGTLGTALEGVQVSFRQLGGAVLCSATATPSGPGRATASCTAPALTVGSRALIVSATSNRYRGPVDVAVSTVAQVSSGSAAGAGRAGSSPDDFGFQARPTRKGAPTGDAIHVFRSGGYAYVVRTTQLASLSVSCTGGKTKACSSVVQGTGATTTAILLADGSPGSATGSSQLRIDATDNAEPVSGSVPADRYAVDISGTTDHQLASPSTQAPLTAGNIRVPS